MLDAMATSSAVDADGEISSIARLSLISELSGGLAFFASELVIASISKEGQQRARL